MKTQMHFMNVVIKALLVQLLCLIVTDANGMFLYFSDLHHYYDYYFIFCV